MSFLDPTLEVSLALENRRELIVHGLEIRRELHFKAKTLVLLKINGENIRFGRVVFVEGQQTYEDKDLPGVIEYYGPASEEEAASYLLRLWVNTVAFEDLRTFDQSTHHLEFHAYATATHKETLAREIPGRAWNAKDESQLALRDFAVWIKPNSDIGEFDEPIREPEPKMNPFEVQVLANLQGMGKILTWVLGVVFGLAIILAFFRR